MARDLVVNREIAQALKEVGAPQEADLYWVSKDAQRWFLWRAPRPDPLYDAYIDTSAAFTLGEIIRYLGKDFGILEHLDSGRWGAYIRHDCGINGTGATPEEAVGRLWLAVLQGALEHGG